MFKRWQELNFGRLGFLPFSIGLQKYDNTENADVKKVTDFPPDRIHPETQLIWIETVI